jgi:hypothetical protein
MRPLIVFSDVTPNLFMAGPFSDLAGRPRRGASAHDPQQSHEAVVA